MCSKAETKSLNPLINWTFKFYNDLLFILLTVGTMPVMFIYLNICWVIEIHKWYKANLFG